MPTVVGVVGPARPRERKLPKEAASLGLGVILGVPRHKLTLPKAAEPYARGGSGGKDLVGGY